jgi:predicted phosphodiesterase
MTVLWGTTFGGADPGTVYYGPAPGAYTQSVSSVNFFGRQTADIDGLSPGQTVYYYVASEGDVIGQNDANYFFTTSPVSDGSFRFAAYGDSRTQPSKHAEVVEMIRANSPNMIIHVGDYVGTESIENYETEFFTPAAPMLRNVPLFTSRGNHDMGWFAYFFASPVSGSPHYYSFDYGLAHFVCLDTNLLLDGGSPEQEAALMDDLAANTKPWTFVFFHHPPFSSGSHGDYEIVKTTWVPIFEQYDVTMVFTGHDHIYDAYLKDDVYYIVTGGGGGPLGTGSPNPPYQIFDVYNIRYHCCIIDVSADQLEFRGIDKHGVFHTITIPRRYRLSVTVNDKSWGDVDLDPAPSDANRPVYVTGTEVTLTAQPDPDRGFKHWKIYNPNNPDDANRTILDANLSTRIMMDADREVRAVFKCGGGEARMTPFLVLGAAMCRVASRRMRRRS